MIDALPRDTEDAARQDRAEPRLVEQWLRVALVQRYGPPVTTPLPETLRLLVDSAG